ncbi:response regulator [Paraglaciecola sp. L1A13]|uniref:response regulator n=1 Tax=Paraglaciecola sp. L1A13 TaxID=2686359 RepID=UPI00131E063C|nr:response regulator [Paraglaciecola sp. L1A13]
MQNILLADLSIILVEPSDTQRKIISTLLHEENVKNVFAVSNVKEAIEAIDQQGGDLVVSSMYLEDGTGLDILKSIKQSSIHCALPFMLVSSESSSQKLEEFKQAGVAAILPKPFSTEHLSRALKTSLDLINTEELDLNLFDVRQVRVLLVDDSKLARNHINRVLKGLGIEQIIEAENGAMALTILKENTFDLVVTDYNMPEMNGRELSEFIRFNTETSHLPIIMVTSESVDSLHMTNIHQAGVNALCDKPFEVEQVKMLLSSLLNE